jgi:serine/threonine protein kinase
MVMDTNTFHVVGMGGMPTYCHHPFLGFVYSTKKGEFRVLFFGREGRSHALFLGVTHTLDTRYHPMALPPTTNASTPDTWAPSPVDLLSLAPSYTSASSTTSPSASKELSWIVIKNKLLSPGGHSQVSIVQFHGEPQLYILKEAKPYCQAEMDTEIAVLYQLTPHRHIGGVSWGHMARIRTKEPVLISPYYPNGTISECLKMIPVLERLQQAHRWMLQIAMAIFNIHDCGFIHRDIKPQNIVVDEKFNAKVIDLGCATVDNGKEHSEQMVTAGYRSIDMLRGNRMYNGSIDMYAWAIIYVEFLTHKPLFGEFRQDTSIQTMIDTYERKLYTKHHKKGTTDVARRLQKHVVPPLLCDLLIQCLDPEQTKRPKTSEVVHTLIQWDLGGYFPKAKTELTKEPLQKRRRVDGIPHAS